MSEQDGERPAAEQPAAEQDAAEQEAAEQEAAEPEAAEPRKEQRSRQHEPLVSGGAESTREMREMSRRRREAEEKLQHHLLEAKEKSTED
ncbi:hypothetical protein SAMN04487916_10568 [Arthrobacter sp. ov407]|uniref:hypothetical protein n=1 Tax=Arthrobacter sp. ov407 TaxID=1761748 RepID=UPI00088BC2D3|nr:hypothetical protein [Arthrobacter sp. ov407]SDL02490.1 hypothetical protein SAMN04487916_10568 [Arthrobacter sp. ov407]